MNYSVIAQGWSFGKALEEIKELGYNGEEFAMSLPKWSDDVVIKVQRPDEYSKMTAPYLYVESRFGRVPWIPTQIELMSDEWCVLLEEE